MAVKDGDELAEVLEQTETALQQASEELGRTRQAIAEAVREQPGLSLAELEERFGIAPAALIAFAETAAGVLGEKPLTEAAARRAAVLAAAAEVWEGEIGPLFDSRQVRELLGGVTRQRVDERVRARQLVAIRDSGGRWRFPAFQFDDGRPDETLVELYWRLVDAPLDGWSAAAWLTAPDELLDGRSPAAHLRSGGDPELLQRLADRDISRLSQ